MSDSATRTATVEQPREPRVRMSRRWPKVKVAFDSGEVQTTGTLKNLSAHGMFVRAETLPRVGDPIMAVFRADSQRSISVIGIVRWTTAQLDPALGARPGFGLSIEEPGQDYLDFFQRVLAAGEDPEPG